MEKNIQEKLLIDLYTLRAGISSVAILSEQIKEKKEMKNLELTYPANDESILSNQTSIHCTPKKYYINGNLNNSNIYNECLFNDIKISLKEKKQARKTKKYFAFYTTSLAISLALLITCVALTAFFATNLFEKNVAIICCSIGIILAFFASCYFGETLINAFVKQKRDDIVIEKYENFVKEYPAYCDYIQKNIEENQKNINQLTDDLCKILNYLKIEYSSLIDYSKWKYLDLLIYNAEACSEKTIGEILTLLDCKEQDASFESMVIIASTEIKNKLSTDCNALCVMVDKRFENFAKNIESFSESFSFSKALLEKSNTSSFDLMYTIENCNLL